MPFAELTAFQILTALCLSDTLTELDGDIALWAYTIGYELIKTYHLPPSLIARLENRTIFIQPGLTFEEEVASIGHEDYHFRFDAQGSDVSKGINTSIKGMNTGLSEDEKILREIRADMYGSLVAVPTLKIFGDLARFRKHSSLSDKLKIIRLYVYKKYKI